MLKCRTKEAICDHIVKFNFRKSQKKLNAHFLLRTVQKFGDILSSELADPWVFGKFAWVFFGILEFFRAWVFLKRPKKSLHKLILPKTCPFFFRHDLGVAQPANPMISQVVSKLEELVKQEPVALMVGGKRSLEISLNRSENSTGQRDQISISGGGARKKVMQQSAPVATLTGTKIQA